MRLIWDRGGEAHFTRRDADDRVELRSSVPAAPGTPLSGTNPEGVRYFVKARTCRKVQDPPAFLIEGRLFDLTRAMRSALDAALLNAGTRDPE